MTSLERVHARLQGKPVDKIPNLNIVMALAAKNANVSYREYVLDYRYLVEGNLRCIEKFGIDAVSAISDPMREASAFGAKIQFPENGVPYSDPLLLEGTPDLSLLQIIDPLNSPRTLDRVKAVEALRREVGNNYPVIGWVEGVLAETADLYGVDELLYALMDDEAFLPELMDIIFKQQCRFAQVQIEAGADFIGIGNAVASLVGPELYEKYALSYDKALTEFIRERGARVKLHICGNITPLLGLLSQVAPDILDIDWMVDFSTAIKAFSGKPTSISGNVNPVSVLLQGDAEMIRNKVKECIDQSDETTMIAAGCEVPGDTPEENLILMDSLLYRRT